MIMKILKIVFPALLAVFLFLLLTADSVKDINIEQLKEEYTSDESTASMTKGSDLMLKRFFGIDAQDLNGYIYERSSSLMNVNELLILKTADETSAGSYERNCEKRLSVLRADFTGYGSDQLTVIDNAVIEVKGNYLFYAASPSAERWEELFREAVKKP